MGIVLHVCIILLQHGKKELMLRMTDRLDYKAVVPGKVEERARLARRAQFREDVLGRQREQIVGRIKLKAVFAKITKNPWCIILKLEVILGGRR